MPLPSPPRTVIKNILSMTKPINVIGAIRAIRNCKDGHRMKVEIVPLLSMKSMLTDPITMPSASSDMLTENSTPFQEQMKKTPIFKFLKATSGISMMKRLLPH